MSDASLEHAANLGQGRPHALEGRPGGKPRAVCSSAASVAKANSTERASALYRTNLWRAGLWTATRLPQGVANRVARMLAAFYWRFNSRRREIVIENLQPVLAGDRQRAEAMSREVFHQFAQKLTDLWRYERGLPVEQLISDLQGWEHLSNAQKSGAGILLLTPHLGNWELGAPLLAQQGLPVTVITLHEPESTLTELRKASRSKWGIETIVIGEDPFAFVDVIARLEAGGTVALLMDRPPRYSATEVTLFGQPFRASIAAAELARATGCALLPACLPRQRHGYQAQVLPPIAYHRAELNSRHARTQLTQQIVSVFEPWIQQYLTQWYHFIPIWPKV